MFNKLSKITIKTKLNDHFAVVRLADQLATGVITVSMTTDGEIDVIFNMTKSATKKLRLIRSLKTLKLEGIKAEIKE